MQHTTKPMRGGNNASNSERNETNNRWRYQVNEGLYLPTGTQVEVANSLVNLPGIVGSSIEIEAEIEETICFQYYVTDTSIQVPKSKLGDPKSTIAFDALLDVMIQNNPDMMSGNAYINEASKSGLFRASWGFSEVIMPLQTFAKVNTDAGEEIITTPLCAQVSVKIPKGIYSITELAELITDQMNRRINLDNPELTYINEIKQNYDGTTATEPFNGLAVNNTTNRLVRVETPSFWDNYVNAYPPGNPGMPLTQTDLTLAPRIGALENTDRAIPSVIAVLPEEARHIKERIKRPDNYSASVPNDLKPDELIIKTQADRIYSRGFQQINGQPAKAGALLTPPSSQNLLNGLTYNVFDQESMAVGTTKFQVSYSSDKSGFNINYAHQPRQIPTHDKRGNSLSNPGAEAVYMKRVPRNNKMFNEFFVLPAGGDAADKFALQPYPDVGGAGGNATENDMNIIRNSCNVPVSRIGGIMIYNWGLETARRLGTDKWVLGLSNDIQELYTFEEFFTTTTEAKNAWKQTLWGRLGFTYDQLQNSNNWETQVYYGRTPTQTEGFTTNAEVDPSIIPFQSTLYNAFNITAEQDPQGDQLFALPGVASLQVFNLLDSNVPPIAFNNNKKLSGEGIVAPFEGSFYDLSVMIPIQTTSDGLTARNLPILSKNGYMLVLSDIVDQMDFAKDRREIGIIDMVSKSSLSNQDFISDRQVLTHVLSNPKSINYININIVNPDLTDIALEPSSTILLKLTFPRPKNTILIQNTEDTIADNIITQQTQQAFMEEMKQSGASIPAGSGGRGQPQPPSDSAPKAERKPRETKEAPVREREEKPEEEEHEEGGEGRPVRTSEHRAIIPGGGRAPRSELRGGEGDEPRRFPKARPDPRLSGDAEAQYKRERQRVAELVDKGKISNVEAKTRLNQIRRRYLPDTAPVTVLRPMGSSAHGVRERLSRTAHGRDARDSLRQQQSQQSTERKK